MPIIRYFVCVGGALLALLFAAEWYFPALADRTNAEADAARVDKTVIRIHSARSLPERIVFDTAAPNVAPTTAAVDSRAEPRGDRVRQVSAAMQETKPSTASTETREHAERRVRARRTPKMTRRQSERRLAFEPRGFFDEWR